MPQKDDIVQTLERLEHYQIPWMFEEGPLEKGELGSVEWALVRYLETERHSLDWFKLIGTNCLGILLIATLDLHRQAHATARQHIDPRDAGLPGGCSLEREVVLILRSLSYKNTDQRFDRLFGTVLGQPFRKLRLGLQGATKQNLLQHPFGYEKWHTSLTEKLQQQVHFKFQRGQVVLASLETALEKII